MSENTLACWVLTTATSDLVMVLESVARTKAGVRKMGGVCPAPMEVEDEVWSGRGESMEWLCWFEDCAYLSQP